MLSNATTVVNCLNSSYQRTAAAGRGAEGWEGGLPWGAAGAETLGAGWQAWREV